jgi:hypothetical protein
LKSGDREEVNMLKRLLLASAVSGLMASGAWAQGPAAAAAGDAPGGTFISAQGPGQWVFSKLKGANVLGPSDEHIGDVSDLLFDKSGKVDGVIVGVGGFLGIGQKNVAIDLSAFQVVPAGNDGTTGTSSNDATDVKLKVSWNKEQLQAAPDFQYYKPTAATVGTGPTTGIGMRPNPPVPAPRSQ